MTAWRFSLLLGAVIGVVGCARWSSTTPLPARNSLVLDQLVVFSDSPLPAHHRLLEELRLQRAMLSSKLELPVSDEPIHVYLFPTDEKLSAFIKAHYPGMPDRRAFFVETDTRLSVYAYWGDRVAEDLRHEVAHGYLHSVLSHLPLWLDEGLAEYFEVPRGQGGLNRPHVAQLSAQLNSSWRPDLARLERMQAIGEMTQADYAESWAWVHFLLETTPGRQDLLREYLAGLPKTPGEPLSARLERTEGDVSAKLSAHLRVLSTSLR